MKRFAKRVEKASICAYVALIDSSPWELRDGAFQLTPPKGFENILERYQAIAARYGVNMATERDTVPAYLARYKPQPVIELENAVWKLVVMPGSNGKVVRWLHKPSGRQLVRGRLMGGRIRGVFEEWMPIGCPKPDGKNPVLDAKVNGNSIELTKRLSHGGVIVRTLWLDDKVPDKVFCKTVCTNKGSKPWTHQLKIHPEFDAGTEDFRQLEVVRYLDGKWQGFAPIGLPSGDHLQEPVVAAEDTWHAFYNRAAGFGVRASYNPKQIAERYIWVSPKRRQFNLELIAKTVTLQPGESSSVEYEFDYLDGLPEVVAP